MPRRAVAAVNTVKLSSKRTVLSEVQAARRNRPMELRYEFSAPQQIVFGWGRRREVGALAATLGRRATIVCGLPDALGGQIIAEIAASLRAEGVEALGVKTILHEPEAADVDRLAAEIRRRGVAAGDFLLAVGGGAAIDLAKAAAALAADRQSDSVQDYLEGVGRGLKLAEPPLAVLAMPTTAGTGTEATRNAVISSYDPPYKKSLRDLRILPRIALVNPEFGGLAAAGRHGGQRHGRHHATHRELHFAQGPSHPTGVGGFRPATGDSGD